MKDEKKDDEKAREFLDLDVKEVSMVDRPANLREFLVVKRLEDEMGAFEADHVGADPSEIGLSRTTPETPSGGEEVTVEKAAAARVGDLAEVSEFLSREDVEKAEVPADLKSAITRVVQFLGKVAGGKYPMPAGKAKKPEEEEEMKAGVQKAAAEAVSELAGVSEILGQEKVEKAVPAGLKAAITRVIMFLGKVAGGKYPMPAGKAKKPEEEEAAKKKAKEDEEEAKKKAGVKKNAEEETPSVQIYDDGRVVVAGQLVSKARGFTANRTNTVKEVVRSLATLLKEVDEDALKGLITEMGSTPSLPADPKVDSGVPAVPAAVQKNAGEDVVQLIKDLGIRLEAIEKARSPSTSVEGDGGSETKVETKKSFWSGVLY